MKARWSRSWLTESETVADVIPRGLLISIQPRFAEAILNGTKTTELRRTMPTLTAGAPVLIYSSSPTKALVGWATLEEIVQATPSALWKEHRESTGVTSAEFKEYFTGSCDAYGIRLSAVRRAAQQVSLAGLRSHGLEPPQSWRYIEADLATSLRQEMAGAASNRRVDRPSRLRHLAEAVG